MYVEDFIKKNVFLHSGSYNISLLLMDSWIPCI